MGHLTLVGHPQNGKWKQHNVFWFRCLPFKKPYLAWSIMFIALWTTTNAAMNATMIWQNILPSFGYNNGTICTMFYFDKHKDRWFDNMTNAAGNFWWPSTKPRFSSRQARTKTHCETRHSLLEVIDGFKPQENGRIILNGMENQKDVKSPIHTLTLSIFEPFASLEAS